MRSRSKRKIRAIILCVHLIALDCCSANHLHHESLQYRKTLEEQNCNLCAYPGSSMRSEFVPIVSKGTLGVFSDLGLKAVPLGNKWTCADWNDIAKEMPDNDSSSCIDMQDLLNRQCCDGLPALHECETLIDATIFTEKYKKKIVPIVNGDVLDVSILVQISKVAIIDHGVDGGALGITGYISFQWIDERLKWNATEMGCATTSEDESDKIWMPHLSIDSHDNFYEDNHIQVVGTKNSADGRIMFTQEFRMRAGCKTVKSRASKLCSLNFHGSHDSKVRYVANGGMDGKGILLDDIFSLKEYKFDSKWSNITDQSSNTRGGLVHDVRVNIEFSPQGDHDCSICGGVAKLYDGIINDFDEDWLNFFPDSEGLSCTQLDTLLFPFSITSEECSVGRANFEEACCDDTRSSYECESNIHDNFIGRHNTVTPPDPHAKEGNQSLTSKDIIDVGISLDVVHVVGIDVKSNSIRMLVGLELDWFDARLVWEPFIGGCHRVSYRASLDAEQTEIWVPNIELVNLVESIQNLPEAFASVWYDGHVRWRRTGILEGVCDLSGITDFPFDTVSCSLEFGGTRDPFFHRVGYHLERIEYSQQVSDESWNFQQYKLMHNRTDLSMREERLSGFENKVVAVNFYFDRAHNFYVHMFVILYIIFTYLSFGMYFIDFKVGERLGYGASILFVIVAQDITMTEATPVTQEFLWIYKLSLGSKMFVVASIIQSIIILWMYTNWEWKGELNKKDSPRNNLEEVQGSIEQYDTHNEPVIRRCRNISFVDEDTGDGQCKTQNVSSEAKSKAVRAVKNKYMWMGNQLLHSVLHKGDSARTKRIKKLKLADITSAFICFLSYTIFLMAMFLSV